MMDNLSAGAFVRDASTIPGLQFCDSYSLSGCLILFDMSETRYMGLDRDFLVENKISFYQTLYVKYT